MNWFRNGINTASGNETAAADLSGRPFCVWKAEMPAKFLGTFNAPLVEEFWRAVAGTGLMNLHVVCHHGKNTH